MTRPLGTDSPAPETAGTAQSAGLDVERVRRDFPALHQEVHGHPLVYLDNAATTQKPTAVLDALDGFYRRDCSNVHRGVHELSIRATQAYEGARTRMRRFLNAASDREIVFVRGATEALNLVAQSWARPRLRKGDEILVSNLEHHSNIVPWQLVCQQTGAEIRVIPVDDEGRLRQDAFEALLGPKTRVLAIGHVSNALGTLNPVRDMTSAAHRVGAVVVVDGAQAAPHLRVDVRELGVDFYAVSGHKMYGPTGIGVLYGREELLEAMPPYQGGGDMIRSVSFEGTVYNELPHKFEAGTPNIAGAIGLGAAAEYLDSVGFDAARRHEEDLLACATELLGEIPGLRLYATAGPKAAVLSFNLEGIHPHDVGTVLDQEGVAIRTGHHCAQPLMERFGVAATARASFGIYNTRRECERLAEALRAARRLFG